jgi:ectoine hydroxylase-related dioxygenase (phytanoyl-CoA dioxygenase family)
MTPGFRILDKVLNDRECVVLIDVFSSRDANKSKAGARHLLSIPQIKALANDPRLLRIASDELKAQAVAFRATLFAKTASANWLTVWHQDTALPLKNGFDLEGWGPWSRKLGVLYAHAPFWALKRVVALRIHLDDSDEHNGPLRVLPESHELGVLSDDEVVKVARERDAFECHVSRGGVLVMSPLIVHSSSKMKNGSQRRVIHIEYADSIVLTEEIELAVC